MDCSPLGSSVRSISQARIPGVGCHFLLPGIFLTQGLNSCLLHCRCILYHWATREAHINSGFIEKFQSKEYKSYIQNSNRVSIKDMTCLIWLRFYLINCYKIWVILIPVDYSLHHFVGKKEPKGSLLYCKSHVFGPQSPDSWPP